MENNQNLVIDAKEAKMLSNINQRSMLSLVFDRIRIYANQGKDYAVINYIFLESEIKELEKLGFKVSINKDEFGSKFFLITW